MESALPDLAGMRFFIPLMECNVVETNLICSFQLHRIFIQDTVQLLYVKVVFFFKLNSQNWNSINMTHTFSIFDKIF